MSEYFKKFKDHTYFLIPRIIPNRSIFDEGFLYSEVVQYTLTSHLVLHFDTKWVNENYNRLLYKLNQESNFYNMNTDSDVAVSFEIPEHISSLAICNKILSGRNCIKSETIIYDTISFWFLNCDNCKTPTARESSRGLFYSDSFIIWCLK